MLEGRVNMFENQVLDNNTSVVIFSLNPTLKSVSLINDWTDKGFMVSEIWDALAVRYSKMIEQRYSIPCTTKNLDQLSFLKNRLDIVATETFSGGNLSEILSHEVGHLNISLILSASNWRLIIQIEK